MVGQSVVVELSQGDKVQIYMFTHTGLMDKRSNWLTHFIGVFLRPKDFMKDTESGPQIAIANGHWLWIERIKLLLRKRLLFKYLNLEYRF